MRPRRRLWPALLLSAALLGGCEGGFELTGTYDCEEDVLELRDDGTFAIVGDDRALEGTYDVEGATIAFTVDGADTAEALIRSDGSLVFSGEEEPCVKR